MMDVDDGIFPPGRITISGTREIKKIKQLIPGFIIITVAHLSSLRLFPSPQDWPSGVA